MGAWGYRIFEDDTTCDALLDLTECEEIYGCLERFIDNVIEQADEYIEYDVGAYGLAAAAAVYLLGGGDKSREYIDGFPEEMNELLDAYGSSDFSGLYGRAAAAVRYVAEGSSELRELWEENEDCFDSWKSCLFALAADLEEL